MMIHPGFVGIDVSKHHLDIFAGGRTERIANDADSVAALLGRWRESFVLFEATGRYDRCLRQALAAAGIAFARVNPARARAGTTPFGLQYICKTNFRSDGELQQ